MVMQMTLKTTIVLVPNLPGDEEHCITMLENCVNDIRVWMRTNKLKLNDEKTEFLVVATDNNWQK